MTTNHIGLLTVIVGTALLAYSVKVKRQYSGNMSHIVDNLKEQDPALLEPTETSIDITRFRSGLALVAIGSLMQW